VVVDEDGENAVVEARSEDEGVFEGTFTSTEKEKESKQRRRRCD